MDIWLIRNGEKYGPFHDYDIRRRIEGGELDPASPAWHEGLAGWIPISEIPVFKNEYLATPKLAPSPVEEQQQEAAPSATTTAGAIPPPLPEKPKIHRRFWARWMDLTVYFAAWWLVFWATGRDVEAIFLNPWIPLAQFVPWFVIEIFLIHHLATTPGKWLLGLRVLNIDGSRLNLLQATRRSMTVYVLGVGLVWFPVVIVSMAFSVFTTKRVGAPIWDYIGKHRVVSKPLNPIGIISVIVLFFASWQAVNGVLSPYVFRAQMEFVNKYAPQYKEEIEKNPPWSLPRRHK
jgi:uncharacterized RDD family membrane protein YckC